MKKITIAIPLVLALAGCGSFQLGTSYAPPGVSRQQLEQDSLVCKDRTHTETNTNGRQVGSFLAGMTIVGAPIAIESEKTEQRRVFKECMEAKGYRVEPPAETRAQ